MSPNRYLYNGNERETGLGVNMYDFNARTYVSSYPLFGRPDPKCTEFPWLNPYTFCGGDPVNHSDPSGKEPDDYEGALMAAACYNDEDEKSKGGMEKTNAEKAATRGWIRDEELSKMLFGHMNEKGTGLQGTVYKRTSKGKSEYTCAFAGTASVEDGIEDALQLIGQAPQPYLGAAIGNNLVRILKYRGETNIDLTFVGHSLGAAIASLSAIVTGYKAMGYNPAALSDLTILRTFHLPWRKYNNITNYIGSRSYSGRKVIADPLNIAQFLIGMSPKGRMNYIDIGPQYNHSIQSLIDVLEPK